MVKQTNTNGRKFIKGLVGLAVGAMATGIALGIGFVKLDTYEREKFIAQYKTIEMEKRWNEQEHKIYVSRLMEEVEIYNKNGDPMKPMINIIGYKGFPQEI